MRVLGFCFVLEIHRAGFTDYREEENYRFFKTTG